jgi:hypothetical protein
VILEYFLTLNSMPFVVFFFALYDYIVVVIYSYFINFFSFNYYGLNVT